jgi:ABC-type dipeptide/oligopeptide/nickel transport system permease subunit
LLAAATATDESTLRAVIREILPNVMLDVAMRPPG